MYLCFCLVPCVHAAINQTVPTVIIFIFFTLQLYIKFLHSVRDLQNYHVREYINIKSGAYDNAINTGWHMLIYIFVVKQVFYEKGNRNYYYYMNLKRLVKCWNLIITFP